MNNAIEMLYGEHEIIISALSITQTLKGLSDQKPEEYEETVRKLLVFLRGFADEFHHYKEEMILFPEIAKKNELLAEGVIKEMIENHEDFREMIQNIDDRLKEKEYEKAQKQLEAYVNMLLDHIAVENEELFQAAESLFTPAELENINYRFHDIDREFGNAKKVYLVELAELIREDFE
jgi:hemerythrin-like domain-containing protein